MRVFVIIFILGFSAFVTQAADLPVPSEGGGGMNPLDEDRAVLWEDTPNLDGLVGSSEQMSEFDLETEIANDFLVEIDVTICRWTWWGAYWAYIPGDPHALYWILRIYEDGDCVPSSLLAEIVTPDNADETLISYDELPIYVYEYCECLPFHANAYWFGAIAGDHPFPPQWGRLAATHVPRCDSVFKSEHFSYPNWTPAIDVFGEAYDASQRMEDDCGTPVDMTTWGTVKSLYR